MNEEDFKKRMGISLDAFKDLPTFTLGTDDDVSDLPVSKSWRNDKCTGAVRNQGGCGSCWAFSAVDTFADKYCLASGKTVVLSPENLLDCDTDAEGCHGAKGLDAPWEFLKNTGIHTESCYPYKADSEDFTESCKTDCSDNSLWSTVFKAKD